MRKEMDAHVFMRSCGYSDMYTHMCSMRKEMNAHVIMRLCRYSYMYTHMCTQVL